MKMDLANLYSYVPAEGSLMVLLKLSMLISITLYKRQMKSHVAFMYLLKVLSNILIMLFLDFLDLHHMPNSSRK